MKLAEALQERADLQREISQLGARLCANAVMQEGQLPAEDPTELMSQLNRSASRLEELTAKINLRNSSVTHEGRTLTEMLAQRDTMSQQINILRQFAASASALTHRGMRSEIAMLSTVNVRELQKKLDEMSKQLRQLDNKIQSINWTTEL